MRVSGKRGRLAVLGGLSTQMVTAMRVFGEMVRLAARASTCTLMAVATSVSSTLTIRMALGGKNGPMEQSLRASS